MKILISDFDNTFFTKDFDENIKLINEFTNQGNKFVIATGRPLYFLKPDIENKNINCCNYICSDGTVIFDSNEKVIYKEIITKKTIMKLIEKVKNNPNIKDYYINTPYEKTKDINMVANGFLGVPTSKEQGILFVKKINKIDKNVKGYFSHVWINVLNSNASKSNGIKKLMEINNWNYEDIITIGDAENDYEMNKEFTSYCMSFSPDSLKKVSNYIVNDFKECIDILSKKH